MRGYLAGNSSPQRGSSPLQRLLGMSAANGTSDRTLFLVGHTRSDHVLPLQRMKIGTGEREVRYRADQFVAGRQSEQVACSLSASSQAGLAVAARRHFKMGLETLSGDEAVLVLLRVSQCIGPAQHVIDRCPHDAAVKGNAVAILYLKGSDREFSIRGQEDAERWIRGEARIDQTEIIVEQNAPLLHHVRGMTHVHADATRRHRSK